MAMRGNMHMDTWIKEVTRFKYQPIQYALFHSRYTIKRITENKEKIEALNDTI